ncbi:alpha/beta hydrolase [Methanococcoides alaskense]|uniref:Dienelactone hydrolase n=1 Tax=Methanococcoides alaskense TaxID=325778 RepID=A0AA90U1G7_9EURY|nr:alpha/beta hydrolase [Methanococcoides alaskense]MDA0525499.1 alpha/beta hydrolase [Methanococcoides alaskense]MDR6223877.1 dienelactone hydrolase [Methanococcoides alaskense]
MAKNRSKNKDTLKMKRILKNNNLVLVIGILLILSGLYGIMFNQGDTWSVTEDGLLSYPERDDIQYSVIDVDDSNSNYTVSTIEYRGRSRTVPSLLTIPRTTTDSQIPAIVVLPGAGVTKEDEHGLSVILADMGYASIIIDQRDLGAIDLESDVEMFKTGVEPTQYLMIYDALKASDVLGVQPEIDASKIAMLGSSNGGRPAIIATAIDDSISGVVAISTSGYDSSAIDPAQVKDKLAYEFFRSIDPDNYLAEISPRPFVMLNSINDSIIPYDAAQITFEKAEDPKSFTAIDSTTHGYTGLMHSHLEEGLELIFE